MVSSFCNCFETGFAEFFGEVDENPNEFPAFAIGVPRIEVFVAVVLEFGFPAVFAFAGYGAEEMGDRGEFIGFVEVYGFDGSGGG